MSNSNRPTYFILFLVAGALVFYALPWVVSPGVGLSLGGYDLAEWASLHPLVRISDPPLQTSLFLRLPLLFLTLLVCFSVPTPVARSWIWWFGLVSFLIFVASSLPPLEYFTDQRSDPNYRQQFQLTITTLVLGLIGLSGFFKQVRSLVIVLSAAAIIVVSILGAQDANQLLNGMSGSTSVGIGLWGMCLLMGLVIISIIYLRISRFTYFS